jgi:hypothetical protein
MQQEMAKIAVAKEAATVDEIQSKTVLNEAKAGEIGVKTQVIPFEAANNARMAQDAANTSNTRN